MLSKPSGDIARARRGRGTATPSELALLPPSHLASCSFSLPFSVGVLGLLLPLLLPLLTWQPLDALPRRLLGVNVDPFLMAVAVGASCAFLTPIGHQNNTLIMGPAGYKFGDYWRMGLPLEILIIAISVPMILFVWPLT